MPHFKCVPCKTRLDVPGGRADLVGDLCPGCGSLLEPVGELAEVVGFQSIKSRDDAAAGGTSSTHERLTDRLGDFIARREACLARERLDFQPGLALEAMARRHSRDSALPPATRLEP